MWRCVTTTYVILLFTSLTYLQTFYTENTAIIQDLMIGRFLFIWSNDPDFIAGVKFTICLMVACFVHHNWGSILSFISISYHFLPSWGPGTLIKLVTSLQRTISLHRLAGGLRLPGVTCVFSRVSITPNLARDPSPLHSKLNSSASSWSVLML